MDQRIDDAPSSFFNDILNRLYGGYERSMIVQSAPFFTRRNTIWAMVILGAAGFFLVATLPLDIPTAQGMLAVATIAMGLAPTYLYMQDENRGPFPLFPVLGIFYAVCFGLPVFLYGLGFPDGVAPNVWVHPVADRGALTSISAQIMALGGITVFVVIFHIGRVSLWRNLPVFNVLPITRNRLGANRVIRLLLWGLLLGHLAYMYSPWVQALPSAAQFFQPAGYVSLAGFFVLTQQKSLPIAEIIAVWLFALPALVLKHMVGGLLTPIMMLGILLFFLSWRYRARWVLMFPIIGIVFLVLTYHPATAYRAIDWKSPEYRPLTLLEKAGVFSSLFVKYTTDGTTNRRTVRNMVRRTSFISVFSLTVEKTPLYIPFWDGETYRPLLSSMIPRFFWPEKPEERAGKAFGDRYHLIDPASQTSVNIPWLTELYINFGAYGVFLGMAFFGLLLSALDFIFNNRNLTNIGGAIGLALVFKFVYPESNFSVMAGSFPLQILCFWIYFRVGLKILTKIVPKRQRAS